MLCQTAQLGVESIPPGLYLAQPPLAQFERALPDVRPIDLEYLNRRVIPQPGPQIALSDARRVEGTLKLQIVHIERGGRLDGAPGVSSRSSVNDAGDGQIHIVVAKAEHRAIRARD